MKSNLFRKILILIKATKVLKNWYLYPLAYLRLAKGDHIIFETRTGLKIKIRSDSTDFMAFTHVWLIEEYSNTGFDICDSDVVIDVGAHIGLFALFASQFCKNGKIYCFEPIKENYDLLISNIAINNIANVSAFNLAVTERALPVKIFLNEDEAGHSMFDQNSDFVEAQSTTMKKIFDDNGIVKCDFIKMDCEGAEYEIIRTLPEEYFKKIQKMIIEYHMAEKKPELLQELVSILRSHLFTVRHKTLFKDIGFLYAKSGA